MQSQSFARALRSAATGSLSAAVSRPAATSRIALAHPALRSWQTRSYASNGNGSADQKDAQADAASEQQSQEAAEFLKKVETLESTVKDLKNQLTYGKADFINLQRRSEEEKAATRDFAIQRFASDLLSTIDILTTALKYVKQPIAADNAELKSLYDGVEMTKHELLKTLAKHGVTQFDPTGEKFDPNLHEAMFQAPVPGKEPGTVLETQKLGYMLKSRTLRAAQVGVVQDTN